MEPQSSTLFVAELPNGISTEEFAGPFRQFEGYEDSRLRQDRKENTVGFIEFSSHPHAVRAMEQMQGYKYPRGERGIIIQVARNLAGATRRPKRTTREPREEDYAAQQQQQAAAQAQAYYSRAGGSFPNLMMHPDFAFAYGAFPNTALAYNNVYPAGATLPQEACSTLYVEGLPLDATEREVSHIFRHYPGFQSVRILQKESKQFPQRHFHLCFVEFANKWQAYIAMQALQGYRMDHTDVKGLAISFAKSERKDHGGRGAGGAGGSGGLGGGRGGSGSGADSPSSQ